MTPAPRAWPPVDTEPVKPYPDTPDVGTDLGAHYAHCFGCGDVDGGLRLRRSIGAGDTIVAQFAVTTSHQGAPGLAHGGLLACAFDEALGSTIGQYLRTPAVTGKLETDFLRPVPVGSVLHIAARIDGIAGRKVYTSADGRLDAPDGPVAVRARALFVTVDVSHFTENGRPEDVRSAAEDPDLARQYRYDVNP